VCYFDTATATGTHTRDQHAKGCDDRTNLFCQQDLCMAHALPCFKTVHANDVSSIPGWYTPVQHLTASIWNTAKLRQSNTYKYITHQLASLKFKQNTLDTQIKKNTHQLASRPWPRGRPWHWSHWTPVAWPGCMTCHTRPTPASCHPYSQTTHGSQARFQGWEGHQIRPVQQEDVCRRDQGACMQEKDMFSGSGVKYAMCSKRMHAGEKRTRFQGLDGH